MAYVICILKEPPSFYKSNWVEKFLVRKKSLPFQELNVYLIETNNSLKYLLQFSSVAQSYLSNPMLCSMQGFPVHHQLLETAQTHVHWVSDAIQPSHPLSSPSPPAFNIPEYQGLFQWVSSSHQVAKVMEFQL